MSLPSISTVAEKHGIDLKNATSEEMESILVGAMKIDLKEGLDFLHKKSHEAQQSESGFVCWTEDPNSVLGKQLIRIHAGDVLRTLAQKFFCHNQPLSFANCCNGRVGKPGTETEAFLFQIETQAGPIAYADC